MVIDHFIYCVTGRLKPRLGDSAVEMFQTQPARTSLSYGLVVFDASIVCFM
jgi:hypothetical protein